MLIQESRIEGWRFERDELIVPDNECTLGCESDKWTLWLVERGGDTEIDNMCELLDWNSGTAGTQSKSLRSKSPQSKSP